jgi:hypothetical protein
LESDHLEKEDNKGEPDRRVNKERSKWEKKKFVLLSN